MLSVYALRMSDLEETESSISAICKGSVVVESSASGKI